MSVHFIDPHQKLKKAITVELTAMEVIDVLTALKMLEADQPKLRRLDPDAAASHEAVFTRFKGFLRQLSEGGADAAK